MRWIRACECKELVEPPVVDIIFPPLLHIALFAFEKYLYIKDFDMGKNLLFLI